MYVIETDLGRFEAETERKAKVLLRKAKKAEAEREKRRQMANKLAAAKAAKYLERMLVDGQPFGCVWSLTYDDAMFRQLCWVSDQHQNDPWEWSVYMDNNRTVVRHFPYHEPVMIILSPSGDVEVVITEDRFSNQNERSAVVFAVYEGESGYYRLPTDRFTAEWFTGDKADA